MSCYVAIPSLRDVEDGGFRRLGDDWNQTTEWIHVSANGAAARVEPEKVQFSGLLIVSPYFFRDAEDKAKQHLFKGDAVRSEVCGIFLHPGITNSPGGKEVSEFFQSYETLRKLEPKTVAFTVSGDLPYQVRCLGRIWRWLSKDNDGESNIPKSDADSLDSLKPAFEALRSRGGRDVVVRVAILVQGLIDSEVSSDVKVEFGKRLSTFLERDGAWLLGNDRFKVPLAQIKSQIDGGAVSPESVKALLAAGRDYCEEPKGSQPDAQQR